MSYSHHPASKTLDIGKRLKALARESGVIALKLGTEVEAFDFDTISLLSKLAGNMPTVVKIGGPDARNDIRQCLALGIRSLLSPMVESSYALSNFIRAVKEIAGAEFAGVRKMINVETINAYRSLPEIVNNPAFSFISQVTIGRDDLAGSQHCGVDDDGIYEMAQDICATARRLGRRVSVGGGLTPDNAPLVVEKIQPHYVNTRMLVIEIAKVGNISDAVSRALEFEIFFEDFKAEQLASALDTSRRRIDTLSTRLHPTRNSR